RRKIPNLDPPVGIFANHLRSLFHCDFVSLDSRLNSKKSTMYHSFGSDEEGDHVRILQSCNGLLLYTGSEWPCFFRCGVFRLAFDPRKSIQYKVVLAERPSGDTAIYWNDAFYWLEGLDRELKHCRLNIEDNDHPIMKTLDIPHGLHRGRNFLESFGGHSNDPMLLLMEIPHMLHFEGKNFESCGCLLLDGRFELVFGVFAWENGEEDAFVVINISGKVVKYHLISKTTTEIFDIGSNQMDDDDDAVEFIPPFEVDLNIL
ncbi:hypothetical protein Tco_1208659, partial [Tanacetum coccineum]